MGLKNNFKRNIRQKIVTKHGAVKNLKTLKTLIMGFEQLDDVSLEDDCGRLLITSYLT